jgi:hypothetical protein
LNSNSSRAQQPDPLVPVPTNGVGRRASHATALAEYDPAADSSTAELREQVAARLAAHRARRARLTPAPDPPATAPDLTAPLRPANPIAAAVVARFANSPSYRSLLAGEAERATRQAAAVAEVARRNAVAVAEVQRQLMAELEQAEAAAAAEAAAQATAAAQAEAEAQAQAKAQAAIAAEAAATQVQLLTPTEAPPAAKPWTYFTPGPQASNQPFADPYTPEEEQALDEEIAFRRAPVFSEPDQPLPANLLQFPRQLQAPHRARPVRALGPLAPPVGDTDQAQPHQLRIFEVEADQLSPEPAPTFTMPEWANIWLDQPPAPAPAYEPDLQYAPEVDYEADPHFDLDALNEHLLTEAPVLAHDPFPKLLLPERASRLRRAMATAMDTALIGIGFLAAATTFVALSSSLPLGLPAAVAVVATLAGMAIVYHLLFFTFSEQTPGMRYACIGLCTFAGESPTRRAIRARLFAAILAALPLGLGLWWALFDKDRLTWQDRLTRIYLREY